MLAIKLQRVGKKGQASFRVIVQERRTKLQGRSVEDLGWANPRTDRYEVNKERAVYWLTRGAQPTDTVWNLLVKAGIVRGAKRAVHGKSKVAEEKGPAFATATTGVAKANSEAPAYVETSAGRSAGAQGKKEIGETAAATSVENQVAEGAAPVPAEVPAVAA